MSVTKDDLVEAVTGNDLMLRDMEDYADLLQKFGDMYTTVINQVDENTTAKQMYELLEEAFKMVGPEALLETVALGNRIAEGMAELGNKCSHMLIARKQREIDLRRGLDG